MTRTDIGRIAILLGCSGALVALSACNRGTDGAARTPAPPLAALPLTTTDAPAAPAPPASALPPAPPPPLAHPVDSGDGYAYLDQAYAMGEAFGDSPPDYAVDYEGAQPWIWRGQDDSERVAEAVPGGMRYYYYQPGADTPYLVEDPDDSYAYSGGELVGVYGADGALLPYAEWDARRDIAGRYLARAAALHAASLHQPRLAVAEARWNARRTAVAARQAQWAQAQTRYAAWAGYHQAHQAQEQAHWAAERAQRQAYAARYAPSPSPSPAPSQAGGPGPAPHAAPPVRLPAAEAPPPPDMNARAAQAAAARQAEASRRQAAEAAQTRQAEAALAEAQRQAAQAAVERQAQEAQRQAAQAEAARQVQAQAVQARQAEAQAAVQAEAQRQAQAQAQAQVQAARQTQQRALAAPYAAPGAPPHPPQGEGRRRGDAPLRP